MPDGPPDDPEQKSTPQPLTTTAAQLGGIRREALIADLGIPYFAGIARESLITGVGLAGSIGTRSSARNSVNITFAGVVVGGDITLASRARGAATISAALAGRIAAASTGVAWLPVRVAVAARAETMATARLARVNQIPTFARAGTQSRARGMPNISIVPISREWTTIINTG